MAWKTVILAFVLLLWTHKGSDNGPIMQNAPLDGSLEIVFCGDLMQHMPQVRAAEALAGCGERASRRASQALAVPFSAPAASAATVSGPDYRYCFAQVAPMWRGADFVVANLETTLAAQGFSGYPHFVAPWQVARDAHRSGITVMATANNHCCDNGARGISQTIRYLDSLGIAHTGTWHDSTEWRTRNPLMLTKGPFRIAMLNYTYGTNGIAIPEGCVVSEIDTVRMAADILAARSHGATDIIALMHWGEEYQPTPSPRQREVALWLHRHGVGIVIGSHPHVVQPAEYYVAGADTLGVTVYSLGNFVSNQRRERTYGGICVRVRITAGEKHPRYTMDYWNDYVSMDYKGRNYVVIPETLKDSLPPEQQAAFSRLISQQDNTAGLR